MLFFNGEIETCICICISAQNSMYEDAPELKYLKEGQYCQAGREASRPWTTWAVLQSQPGTECGKLAGIHTGDLMRGLGTGQVIRLRWEDWRIGWEQKALEWQGWITRKQQLKWDQVSGMKEQGLNRMSPWHVHDMSKLPSFHFKTWVFFRICQCICPTGIVYKGLFLSCCRCVACGLPHCPRGHPASQPDGEGEQLCGAWQQLQWPSVLWKRKVYHTALWGKTCTETKRHKEKETTIIN